MVNFKKMFRPDSNHKNWPGIITYKSKKIFPFDRFPVKDKDVLIFSIEKTNSRYIQGFCIGVFDGYLKTNDHKTTKRKYSDILFWEDSQSLDIKNIEVKVFTKKDHICISNIWEIEMPDENHYNISESNQGKINPNSVKDVCYYGSDQWLRDRGNGAAMYSEDIPNGKRYFCNDGDEDDDFDDIIFTVKRMAK